MLNIKKIRPLFTKIVTTLDKYEEDQTTKGGLVVAKKQAGSVKEYQRIVAVGSNPAGLKVGDIVMINPARYAVKKYKEGSLKDGVVKENPTIEYRFPIITLESGDHLLIDTMDIDFVIEDFIEESLNERAAKAGIYTPNNQIIS